MPPILGIWASAFAKSTPDTGSYFPLGEFTLNSSRTTVDFTNIPQTYKHLQIRLMARTDRATFSTDTFALRFNSDTSAIYGYHNIYGDGFNVVGAGNTLNDTRILGTQNLLTNAANSNMFGVAVIDILDYNNTNKLKTVRFLAGANANNTGTEEPRLVFSSGLWRSTSAITSVTLSPNNGTNFVANSQFALYGVLA